MKKFVKRAVLEGLKHAGVFRWVAESRWRAGRLLILCYHIVSLEDEHEWQPVTSMPPAAFEARLQLLKSGGYNVLPLGEALKRLGEKSLPVKSVAITFDDGLYSFYVRAFPLLQKYGFPSTLYLTTYYCDRQLPVFPLICSYLLWRKRDTVFQADPSLGTKVSEDLATFAGRHRVWTAIQAHAETRRLTANQKNDLAKRLAEVLDVGFDEIVEKRLFHLMTPDEIREVSGAGLDIQLHTHRHRTPLDQSLFRKEISDNRRRIEELTGKRVNDFCYPSGVYRNEFLPWLREENVTSATTCEPGLADFHTTPLLIPRVLDASNVLPIEFESWASGLNPALPRNLFRHSPRAMGSMEE